MMWMAERKCLTLQTHLFWSSTPGTMSSIEGIDRAFIGQGTTHKILAESCQSIKAGWGGNAGCDRSDPSIHPSDVPPSLPLCRCGSAQSVLGPRTLLLSRSPRVARWGRHRRAFSMETSWDQEVRPTHQNVGQMSHLRWQIRFGTYEDNLQRQWLCYVMWGVNPDDQRKYGLRPKPFTSQDGLLEKGAFRLDSLNENMLEWYVLAADGLMLHGSCKGGLSNKCIWKPLVEHVDSSSSHRCAYIPFITLCTHRHPMHEINGHISCIINKE